MSLQPVPEDRSPEPNELRSVTPPARPRKVAWSRRVEREVNFTFGQLMALIVIPTLIIAVAIVGFAIWEHHNDNVSDAVPAFATPASGTAGVPGDWMSSTGAQWQPSTIVGSDGKTYKLAPSEAAISTQSVYVTAPDGQTYLQVQTPAPKPRHALKH